MPHHLLEDKTKYHSSALRFLAWQREQRSLFHHFFGIIGDFQLLSNKITISYKHFKSETFLYF